MPEVSKNIQTNLKSEAHFYLTIVNLLRKIKKTLLEKSTSRKVLQKMTILRKRTVSFLTERFPGAPQAI